MFKRFKEISTRLKEIEGLIVDADLDTVKSLEKEVIALTEERASLKESQTNLRGKFDDLTTVIEVPAKSVEVDKRAEMGTQLRSKRPITLEMNERAVTVGGGQILTPTGNQTGINEDGLVKYSSIIDLVKVTDTKNMGEYKVPYQNALSAATIKGENDDYAGGEPTFGYATIKPIKITTYAEVSRETLKLTDIAYFEAVQRAAYTALRKKIASLIITGNPNADPVELTGLVNASLVTDTLSVGEINERTLREIAFAFGGDEGIEGNAVLLLNKKTLVAFGDVRGSNEKEAVYTITANGNTGTIQDKGLVVNYVLTDALDSLSDASASDIFMLYGAPTSYEVGLFSDYVVQVSEDAAFKKGMIAVRGEVMVGGNVTSPRGWVAVVKGDAAPEGAKATPVITDATPNTISIATTYANVSELDNAYVQDIIIEFSEALAKGTTINIAALSGSAYSLPTATNRIWMSNLIKSIKADGATRPKLNSLTTQTQLLAIVSEATAFATNVTVKVVTSNAPALEGTYESQKHMTNFTVLGTASKACIITKND